MKKRVRIVLDGHEHEVDASTNVLQAALGAGLNLPYFCWHPALGSVGACRQCAVVQLKDEQDTQGKLVMSCMTPCTDGGRYSLEHPDAREMRTSVIEFLMTNHPHDCPVCEEGGHCHLQDMTVMTGHAYRRYRHAKRTHRNQDLGPFVGHEMNRCIACYRCVRFYKDYAGGSDLDVFGAGNEVYFGRSADGTLASPFSGNLVEVCPTGVFTDKPYGESYTRKWDLQTAPSVCTHCSIGCNISPGERYGTLKRIENRYHGELNGYFLCDRGRFGYGFVNRDDRPREALIRESGGVHVATVDEAAEHVARLLKAGRTLGIGSPRASLEANFALRQLVGAENFFSGQTARDAELTTLGLEILRSGRAHIASVREAERADAVFVLGEDLLNTAPRLALGLRQATRQAGFRMADQAHIPHWQDAAVRTLAQDARSPLYLATAGPTGLDGLAAGTFHGNPVDVARLGMAVAHHLDSAAPHVADLEPGTAELAVRIAATLREARRPLIVSGTGSGSSEVLHATSNLLAALSKAGNKPSVAVVFAEANSAGMALFDALPLERALQKIHSGDVSSVLMVENDLSRRLDAATLATLSEVRHRIVLDALHNPATETATTLLPAGSFAESDGTLVNFEGRAQRFFQVYAPESEAVLESWRWLQRIGSAAGRDLGSTLDDLTTACAHAIPALAGIVKAAPNARFRMAGTRVPRQPHRYSGRTAMHANRDVHESRPPQDPDSPLAFSMEGVTTQAPKPAPLIPMFWAPSWNSPQAVNRFQQEIGGHLRGGDPGERLIHPATAAASPLFPVPSAANGELVSVPVHCLFGSEELSQQAPVMRSRIPAAHVVISPATAGRIHLDGGAIAELGFGGATLRIAVRVEPGFAENCVGVPAGVPGVPVIAPGTPVTLLPEVRRD
jgi:NADH-quinone oxidoreductase subunit G